MSRIGRIWAVVGLCLAIGGAARAADFYRVDVRGGEAVSGTAELGAGRIKVTPPGKEPVEVAAEDLRRIRRLTGLESAALLRESQTAVTAPSSKLGLRGEYFADTELNDPAFERVDPTPNFEGRGGEPNALSVDRLGNSFSVRWTGTITAPSTGEYKFYISSDDATRMWINDVCISDRWGAIVMRDVQGTVSMKSGEPVPIRIEYMDIGYGQFLKLEWEGPDQKRAEVPPGAFLPAVSGKPAEWPGDERRGGWRVEYFRGLEFKTSASLTTESLTVFDWNERSAPSGVPKPDQGFSARFTGVLFPDISGKYRFRIQADDRYRLFLGDTKHADTFADRNFQNEFDVELVRGQPVPIKVEYQNDAANAHLRMQWRRPGMNDFQDLPMGSIGLPREGDVAPMVKIDRVTVPARFFSSEIGEKAAVGRAWSSLGALAKLEWVVDNRVVASAEGSADGILALPLSKLPLGRSTVRFRATDSKGRTSTTEGVVTEAEGVPGGVVTGPWRDARVGDRNGLAVLRKEGSTIALEGGAGDIDLSNDTLRLLCQPAGTNSYVEGCLVSVTSDPAGGFALGGLMIRRSLESQAQMVAVVLDADGKARAVFRKNGWQPAESVPVSVEPGSWVRIAREPDGTRVFSRPNPGAPWRSVLFTDVRMEGECWGGAFAVSRGGTAAVRLRDLAVGTGEVAASEARGVMLTSGTFLAGDARIEDDGRVMVWHRDRGVTFDKGRVAYFAFGRVAGEQVEALSSRAPCALMRADDITEGELIRLNDGRVVWDSDLFGRVSTEVWSGEVRAVALRRFRIVPPKEGVVLRTRDGSLFHAETLTITPESLVLGGASTPEGAGKVTLAEISTTSP